MLVQQVQEHIKQQGLKAVGNITGDNVASQFVESLLGVYTKYKEMTVSVFSSNQQFCSALDIACAAVVNHRSHPKQPCKSPELLAKYCDSLLKKSTKGTGESEVDEKLSHCITVFKYVDDKDVYQKFYSSLLAKRLIHQLSHSMDAEELMINRLKQACGYEFTNKLHRMFTDMSVSSDLNTKFSNTLKDKHELGLNFSINVLQSGAWPLGQSFQAVDFAVPQELERSVQRFEDFYRTQFNGRKLFWLHLMSTCELKVNCLKKPYIITMQALQMALLLMFEKTNSMTCQELSDATKLNTVNFQKYLLSLIDSKLLTVSCNPSEIFEPSTVITLNLDFSSKRTKFKLTYTVQKEAVQETKRSHFAVEMDREMFLQVQTQIYFFNCDTNVYSKKMICLFLGHHCPNHEVEEDSAPQRFDSGSVESVKSSICSVY